MSVLSASRLGSALLLSVSLTACASMSPFGASLDKRVERHVTVLAADDMEGRDTGSEGYARSADYVAEFYARNGIEPAAPNYRQQVPLKSAKVSTLDGVVTVFADGRPVDLAKGETVMTILSSEIDNASASGQLVFVGDGIVAPTLGLNAYQGVDVRGKIVVMLPGAPEIEDNPASVHLRRNDTKAKEAAKRGAVGIIRLDTAGNGIERMKRFTANPERTQVALPSGFDRSIPTVLMGMDAMAEVFEASGRDLEAAKEAFENGEGESFALNGTAMIDGTVEADPIDAFNVVGVIPGNDPELAGEAVVITAHLDHVGMRDDGDPETDDIYNGAMDNATGTAIIMEAGRMLAQKGDNRRTIIIAAVTGEEKGLLGAAYLARNADELGYEFVANVNIDMPVLVYPLNDIIAFGSEYSSLGPQFDAAAAEFGLKATPDPLPELSLFVRSDHYRFVQEGIPSLFMFNGMEGEGKANFEKFMATHYHKPSDEIDLPINWKDGAIFTKITADVVSRIANADEKPSWNEGVVFAPEEPKG